MVACANPNYQSMRSMRVLPFPPPEIKNNYYASKHKQVLLILEAFGGYQPFP